MPLRNFSKFEKLHGMGNTCKPMVVSFQCMTKFTTNKKIKKKKNLRSYRARPLEPESRPIHLLSIVTLDKLLNLSVTDL